MLDEEPLPTATLADYGFPSSDLLPEVARLHLLRNAEAASRSPTPRPVFTLGTRASKLAMIQTEAVKAELEIKWPGIKFQIFGMTTTGDNNTSTPLYLIGGKALWTKELEVELVAGNVDAIVHCLKDMPTDLPPGCELGAIMEREDPSDCMVVKEGLPYTSLDQLPDGSVIGTSSVRRVAQLRATYPKLKFADVRGLVQTRLRKLDDPTSSYTALILASAGLIRLGLSSRITASVTSPSLYHAVGQGALGIEMRTNDPRAAEIVGSLDEWKSSWTARAERSMLHYLEGGCSVPVGCETFLVEEVKQAQCPVIGPRNSSSSLPEPLANAGGPPLQIGGTTHRNGISNGLPIGHPLRPSHPHDPHSATLTLVGNITSLAGTSSVLASATRLIHSISEAEQMGADIAKELVAGGGRAILEELGKHIKDVQGEDGKLIPVEPNGKGNGYPLVKSAVNTAPESKSVHAEPEELSRSSKSAHPHPRAFREGEVCQRPDVSLAVPPAQAVPGRSSMAERLEWGARRHWHLQREGDAVLTYLISYHTVLLAIVGQLRIGMDLTKITLPVAGKLEKPEDRFIQVLRYYLAGWHIKPKGVKKPYNPVIGEFFRCRYDYPDGTVAYYVAEQVSHHPPISAWYFTSPENNLDICGEVRPKSKFLGNSAATIMEGASRVTFLDRPEDKEYNITMPNMYARGILFGKMVLELGDTSTVKNEATGLFCDIEFKTKGFFSGTYNAIAGKIKGPKGEIGDISGKWSDTMDIIKKGGKGKETLFDATSSPEITQKVVAPEEQQSPNESRRLWSKVTAAIKAKDLDAATDAKSAIEDSQRDTTKDRDEKGETFTSRFFVCKNGEWRPNFTLPKASPKEQVTALRSFVYGSDFEPAPTVNAAPPTSAPPA
ncbi:hydroxymethylbilane synthase, partial [Phenoliferia sp. Uapishka_3]